MKEFMEKRYTVKKYLPEKIAAKDIEELKEVLHLSPSSINSQPWNFVFVEDEDKKRQFAEVSMHNKSKIENASCLVVFRVKSVGFFEKEVVNTLPESTQHFYESAIKPLPKEGKEEWMIRQVYISLGVFLASCAVKNIGSTAMEGIDKKAYDNILNDSNYKTVVAVAVGVSDPDDYNRLEVHPKLRISKDKVISLL